MRDVWNDVFCVKEKRSWRAVLFIFMDRSSGSRFQMDYWNIKGFPGSAMLKNSPDNIEDARDMGSTPGSGRCPRVGNGNPLQYSCLENSADRGAWQATVHGVTESDTTEWLNTHIEILNPWFIALVQLWSTGQVMPPLGMSSLLIIWKSPVWKVIAVFPHLTDKQCLFITLILN